MKENGKPIFMINGKPVGFVKEIHLGRIDSDPITTNTIDFSYSGMVDMSNKCSLTYEQEFNEQFNKVKQITMNKQIIEQIEKIKGVKTVEPMNDRVVVTFEAEKVAVKCTNAEQFDFVNSKQTKKITAEFESSVGCIDISGYGYSDEMMFLCKNYNVIPFSQYLTDYNLTDEWGMYLIGEAEKRYPVGTKYYSAYFPSHEDEIKTTNFYIFDKTGVVADSVRGVSVYHDGKWAEIIPNEIELVDGEIYFDKSYNKIFRHGCNSNIDTDRDKKWWGEQWCPEIGDSVVVDATKKQKRKLIRAEVKNNCFHELRSNNS